MDIMSRINENMQAKSACLPYAGKKLKQGLDETSGDVDLLGFELGETLHEKISPPDNTLQQISDAKARIMLEEWEPFTD